MGWPEVRVCRYPDRRRQNPRGAAWSDGGRSDSDRTCV